jgi:hypothetical protein
VLTILAILAAVPSKAGGGHGTTRNRKGFPASWLARSLSVETDGSTNRVCIAVGDKLLEFTNGSTSAVHTTRMEQSLAGI